MTTAAARSPSRVDLPDGRAIDVRPIRVADRSLLGDAFDRLGPESRYRRFLAPIHELSEAMLSHFSDVDHHHHEALVALDPVTGRLIGVARFIRVARDPEAAELAVTVSDEWQSDGVGTVLVAFLVDRAREEGVLRFVGSMYWRNPPMHELLRELGEPEIHGSDGVDEFSLSLPDEPVAGRIPKLLDDVAAATAERRLRIHRANQVSPIPTERSPMFAKIIVGIDGSNGGRDALALAKKLAGQDAEMVLVTAFPHDEVANRATSPGFESLLREDVDKVLHESAAGDSRCRVHAVADSSPARALHDEADREDADLIVVGSCHRGPIGRILVGDVSRATLHGAPCPVAVAPHGYRDAGDASIQTIGVGYNATDESLDALAFSARLAEAVDGRLRLLTAVTSPASMGPAYMYAYNWAEVQAQSRLAAELEISNAADTLSVPTETETIDQSPGVALEHLSEQVDLLIAGSRGWGATHRVVLGSTTDHIAHHAHCPVIIVPSPVNDARRPSHAVLEVLA
jgi:nucleotide-binding universal stress UspA family protein/GNAT superfamily N-acetyltransferase